MAYPTTFRIDRGIGQYDFNDYYAVLGLPLTAEASFVRKRYLMIAKCLHPDVHGRSSEEKQVATLYLSKLVNPAYNVLSHERERTEYSAILKLLGKRLMKRNQKFSPHSELAKRYLISQSIDYEQTIKEIAKVQYHDLNQAIENICLLSELNLVHILLQEGYRPPVSELPKDPEDTLIIVNPASTNSFANSTKPANVSICNNTANGNKANKSNGVAQGSYQMRSESQVPLRDTSQNNGYIKKSQGVSNSSNDLLIEKYILQAESYISQQLWASALKELRVAIQIDCNHSKCHALLGYVYLNQKLAGMAKVSFQQALRLNPEEPLALKHFNQLSSTSPIKDSQAKSKNDKDKKGGFFGWLGGG